MKEKEYQNYLNLYLGVIASVNVKDMEKVLDAIRENGGRIIYVRKSSQHLKIIDGGNDNEE